MFRKGPEVPLIGSFGVSVKSARWLGRLGCFMLSRRNRDDCDARKYGEPARAQAGRDTGGAPAERGGQSVPGADLSARRHLMY